MTAFQVNIPFAIFILLIMMCLLAEYERKRREEGRDKRLLSTTFIDLFSMLAKLCKADGVVTKEEVDFISRYMQHELKLAWDDQQEAIAIFNKAKNSTSTFQFHAQRLKKENAEDILFLTDIVDLFFHLSTQSGILKKEQERLIIESIAIFESHENAYFRYKKAGKGEDSELECRFSLSLGLAAPAEACEVRESYRKLIKKYHPDNVQHLGPEFLELAEKKTKEINEAYHYLKGRIGF